MGTAVAAELFGQREQLPLPQPVEKSLVVGIGTCGGTQAIVTSASVVS